MKWEIETWRKLYVRVDAKWMSLPVSARGLGSELLKYVDDGGRLHLGTDLEPGLAVAYMLGARPKEHRRIAEDFGLLVSSEHAFLIDEGGGAFRIRNFEKAQAKSGSAARMAKLRDNRRQKPSQVTSHVTGVVTSRGDAVVMSRSDDPMTSQSDGSDPIRSDPPNPPGGKGLPPSVSRDPDEIPEGCVDVVYIRAVRRAGAEPDVSQRERGQMAARWAEAQAEGVSWARFCAWLDSWAFDWVSSTISAGKAEFNPGWPWKKFTNFVLAEEAKANGAVPNGESRIRPLTPAQVAARLAVSRGVAVPS